MFAENGSTNVSVEAICTLAGYTRGAFYSNFSSVDDLFFALYQDRSAKVLAQLDQIRHPSARPELAAQPEPAESIVHRVLDALPVDREWFLLRSVVMAQALHRPDLAATLHQHGQAFQVAVQPLLVAAVTRAGRELLVEPEIFTQAVVAAHVGAVSQAVLYDDPTRVREVTVRGTLLGLSAPAANCPTSSGR